MQLFVNTLRKFSKPLVPLCLLAFSTVSLSAHELWIEALEYQIKPQGRLVANIVNGQQFRGHKLAYLPPVAIRFDLVSNGIVTPVRARAGDRPALDIAGIDAGLKVVVYQAANASLTYHGWEKFGSFIDHKDLPTSLEGHLSRGLPPTEFKEVYSRYSKALISVGAGVGADQRMGLTTELVALANPYTDTLPTGLPVQLFLGDKVRADEQIEIFDRDMDGEVVISTIRTGEDGIAVIALAPGHTYMLDAVVLREPSAELAAETGAVWESLWANLTFAVPAIE